MYSKKTCTTVNLVHFCRRKKMLCTGNLPLGEDSTDINPKFSQASHSLNSQSISSSRYLILARGQLSLQQYLNSWLIVYLHNGSSYQGLLKAIDSEKNILLNDADGKNPNLKIEKHLGPICIKRKDIKKILWHP